MRYPLFTATAAAVAVCMMPAAQAGYSFTTGAEYTRGDYATGVGTSTWYVPFILGYSGREYALSVTVPYVSVSGSSQVSASSSHTSRGAGGIRKKTPAGISSAERTDSGLGDITLKASYQFQSETRHRPWIGVTGKVKLGTASTRDNLGSGEDDYALQLDMARGPVDGFIGYMVLGDTGETDYDDIFYGALAITVPLDTVWRMRTELYTEQAAVEGVDPVQEVSVGFARPLDDSQRINLYVIKGLTDSTPEWGAGVMLSTAF